MKFRVEVICVNLIIRNLGFTNFERKRLVERVNKTMDIMRSLDHQVSNLEKKIESTHSEELKKDYRKTQRQGRSPVDACGHTNSGLHLNFPRAPASHHVYITLRILRTFPAGRTAGP
ncbi:MAG: hypothetical protein WCA20_25870 [Candidatus Sulfotelmatobacter sp.]